MTAAELKEIEPSVDAIEKAIAEFVEAENRRKKGPPQPHTYLYASSRRKCLRRSVYECTHPELIPDLPADVKARFLRGDQRETDLRNELAKAGQMSEPRFDFVGAQEAIKIYDRKNRLIISGKIDGSVRWENREIWPGEIKAWHPALVDKFHTFDDVCDNPWTWSGAHQLLSYLYGKSVPYGLLILDRSGLPKLIPVSLEANLERMESFLKDAETVVDHIEANTLPDFIQDASECARCSFYGTLCQPPIMSGQGAQVIDDPEVEQMLELRAQFEEAAKEFNHIDNKIKKRFRGLEVGIAGKFLLQGSWCKNTTYDYPEDVKAKHRKVDPKGKFTLTITKT